MICRESRQVVLNQYEPLLRPPAPSSPGGPRILFGGDVGTFINFQNNDLLIGSRGLKFLGLVGQRVKLNGVKHIEIPVHSLRRLVHSILPSLRRLGCSLESLVAIYGPMHPRWEVEFASSIRIIGMTSNLADLVDSWMLNSYGHIGGLVNRRYLAIAAKARKLKEDIHAYGKTHPLEFSFGVAILARRSKACRDWQVQWHLPNELPEKWPAMSIAYEDGMMCSRYDGLQAMFEDESGPSGINE